MLVNPITPKVTNGTSSANAVSVIPQVHRSIPDSVAFKGTGKRVGILGSIAMALGLAGCPDNSAVPNVDTIPPRTDTTTSTSTATATSTATTPDTAKSKIMAAWEGSGIAMPDADNPPKVIEWDDTFYGGHTTETLDAAKTSSNTVVYNGVVTSATENSSYAKTYAYDEATNTLSVTVKSGITGTEKTATITIDSDGYAVFTNKATGKIDYKMRKIDSGKVGVYDASGNLSDTYANYKNDGYLAKLEKDAKSAKEKLTRLAEEGKKLAARFELPTKPAQFGERLARGIHV